MHQFPLHQPSLDPCFNPFHSLVALTQIRVNNADASKRKRVLATVCHVSDEQDFVLLRTPNLSLESPIIDTACYINQPYILVGASARSQKPDPVSCRHGSLLSTRPDERGFIRGDTPSIPGDSGGGCFCARTGRLFAINVQTTKEGAALLPILMPFIAACKLGLGPSHSRDQSVSHSST